MSDIVEDAKAWLETRPARRFRDGRTHHETCHETHTDCLVERLVAEVERHRMTEEERVCCFDASHDSYDNGAFRVIMAYLVRTAPEGK